MKPVKNIKWYSWRYWLVLLFFFIFIVLLWSRAAQLMLFQQTFLQHQGDIRSLRVIETPASRGMMVDRNYQPLAVSTSVYSVWVNPQQFTLTNENVQLVSTVLSLPLSSLYEKIKTHAHKSFLYLARDLPPELAAQVLDLHLPGIYLENSYKRYYPEGEVASQVLGYTNVDDQGQEGMEFAYNLWLSGKKGKQEVIQDLKGHVVSVLKTIEAQQAGKTLVLSIDKRIQFIAYQALQEAVQTHQAQAGTAVVLDIQTGEILAMVNQPSFNPNDRTTGYSSAYRNRAVTDVFEPGSTMKAFSVFSALDSGKYEPDTVIETAPGYWRVGKNWVRDELNYGTLTVTGVLQKSSNVGVAKMILSLPDNQLWSVLHRVGFGQKTSSYFPGEQAGYLIHQEEWKPFALSTLAFGYGVSVTTLQLAQAYSVIGNHGIKVPVTFLRQEKPVIGEQVIDAAVADKMLLLLESVVDGGGTGSRAGAGGYRVAGKTGTARVAIPGGYDKHAHIGSFVGIAPVSHPRLVVAVVIFKPDERAYFGGLVAAPAFGRIMEHALRLLNVPPDAREKPDL